MRGLVYKEIAIFFKSIVKKTLLIVAVAVTMLMFNAGEYAGMFASVMFAMMVGMQNLMSFANDEKTDWKKYQLAMPINAVSAVGAKYISVICTLAVSVAGSIFFNAIASILYRNFDMAVWGLSVAVSVVLPLAWAELWLPFVYWFGFRSAQIISLTAMVPVFSFITYFEDGVGFSVMPATIMPYVAVAVVVIAGIFIVSMMISVMGYGRKK